MSDERDTAEMLEAFEMLAQLAAMPSDLNDHPDFQERRDELEDDPLDSQRGNW